MHPKDLSIADFNYPLPPERIASHPLAERDGSRLLIYRNGIISESVYKNISGEIPSGALLIFNDTRVLDARIIFTKPSGGNIEIFTLEPAGPFKDMTAALQQTGTVDWKCLVGGASKWKHNFVPEKIINTEKGKVILRAEIRERLTDSFVIRFSWTPFELTFPEILHLAGQVPLPPYIKRIAEDADSVRYQTVYAREAGSVAAPTAGLHFTETIFREFEAKKIKSTFVTLHVGAGTFKPVKSEKISGHEMHSEYLEVNAATIHQLAEHTGPIYAIGTTSLRTLESLYWMGVKIGLRRDIKPDELPVSQWEVYGFPENIDISPKESMENLLQWLTVNSAERLITHTQIMIAPGYRFRMISGLITNFHQPQSTLLLLIAAITGPAWKDIYTYALKNNFRFLSYGDGCLLEIYKNTAPPELNTFP
jgi:S-adenosylmethionine:tRNA ribosyltransferase-isomerase